MFSKLKDGIDPCEKQSVLVFHKYFQMGSLEIMKNLY